MFKKILIANRGEIACRIIKTAKKMNIKTVSIFSDSDRGAQHVLMSNESYYLGKSSLAESYLNQNKILEICKDSGVDAVHPGYGFLSENYAFANLLKLNQIAFIGPSPQAIVDMGDKIKSKKIAKSAGVNIIPGSIGEINSLEEASEISNEIGYPIMIKASAGGGGKGMRIVNCEKEMKDGFLRASSEAKKSFGDDRVFIEKFIEKPRHIEIQVLADNFGNIITLGERECSIQRRNQKIIEEAPSSFLDNKLRNKMSDQAIKLARSVNYKSAGTVEFVVDHNKNFYFLEMNTRLQVEHPVTELITGIDIVREMINIAYNKKLKITQNDVSFNGWAFESRIYAEDPHKDFLPSVGRLIRYSPPTEKRTKSIVIRNDTGVKEGDTISIYYDPMIAKLSTWGKNRDDAIRIMTDSLDKFVIEGVKNNISFLSSVFQNKSFENGKISTLFINQNFPEGFRGISSKKYQDLIFLILLTLGFKENNKHSLKSLGKTFLNVEVFDQYDESKYISEEYSINSDGYFFNISSSNGIKINKNIYEKINVIFSRNFENNLCQFKFMHIDEIIYECFCNVKFRSPFILLQFRGISVTGILRNRESIRLLKYLKTVKPTNSSNLIKCPMPGKLIDIFVKVGFEVEIGDKLCIVEAMKMENILVATKKGKIKKINYKVNDILSVDSIIMEF